MISKILEILYPDKCIFCGKILGKGTACESCENKLPKMKDVLCRTKMGDVSKLYCAIEYTGLVPQAIYKFKFEGKAKLYKYLVDIMTERMGIYLLEEHCDLIMPVPMHKARKRKRGYNQAELLARELSYQLDIKYSEALVKTVKSKQQHTLNREERKFGQKNTYSCEKLNGEKILLIDDICTSGETLKECARVLVEAGASEVIAATICKTPK